MALLLFGILLTPLLATPFEESAGTELRYTGTLTKVAQDAGGQPVKRFSLYCLVLRPAGDVRRIGYLIDERGGGTWPWPERYGLVTLNSKNEATNAAVPRLLYDHEGSPHPVRLPRPFLPHPVPLQAGTSWKVDNETYEVKQAAQSQNRDCWQIEVSTNFGRKRTIWMEKDTSLVVLVEEKLFMGQGVEFAVKLQLESQQSLDEQALAKTVQAFEQLLKLQADLKRGENEQRTELSEPQLAVAREALASIEKSADETAFGHLAGVASRDVKLQLQRTDEVVQLAKQFLGQAAPPFSLELYDDRQVVSPKDREGKITILHLWDYQGEPLLEPYGQVGYLDFLYSRRRKLGMQVYGVAVDPRFGEKDKAAAAVRSVGKLKSFMNLGYPIARDNGELLAKFGDPRKLGAKLPLWVVIDPEGKIVHYSTGFYKINPDEGLRTLDDLVVNLIKEQRDKAEKQSK